MKKQSKKSSARKVADCRDFPDEENPCSLCISGTEDEVMDIAVLHAVNKHGHKDTPGFRAEIRSMLKDE